jgi:hypothetical protein
VRYTVRRWARVGLLTATFLAVQALGWVRLGAAQPTASDRAAAEALFEQALAAMEAGNLAVACPKLEESQRLDPGVGTLLYLADCYETTGRTASAWATFLEAAYMAKDAGQADRQQVAEEHADALKPKLAKLVLLVDEPELPGLVITNDEQPVGEALWASEVPVDPGRHTIAASAEGKQPWSGVVTIPPGPGVTRFTIPKLLDVEVVAVVPPTPPAPTPPQPAPLATPVQSVQADVGVPLKTWGWIGVGVGGAGLVTSGVLSFLALSDNSDADSECRSADPGLCSQQGVELGDSAESKAQAATLFGGIGAALAVTGAVLILMSPEEDSALRVGPQVAAGGAGLLMEGSW